VPTVEGLQLAYALHPLPPGRWGFHRWRWELWHGASLIAAGWRIQRSDAERALRTYASRFAHDLFGLRPARTATSGDFTPGAAVRVTSEAITCVLIPRALQEEHGRAGMAAA
jgi:hypothetical protein